MNRSRYQPPLCESDFHVDMDDNYSKLNTPLKISVHYPKKKTNTTVISYSKEIQVQRQIKKVKSKGRLDLSKHSNKDVIFNDYDKYNSSFTNLVCFPEKSNPIQKPPQAESRTINIQNTGNAGKISSYIIRNKKEKSLTSSKSTGNYKLPTKDEPLQIEELNTKKVSSKEKQDYNIKIPGEHSRGKYKPTYNLPPALNKRFYLSNNSNTDKNKTFSSSYYGKPPKFQEEFTDKKLFSNTSNFGYSTGNTIQAERSLINKPMNKSTSMTILRPPNSNISVIKKRKYSGGVVEFMGSHERFENIRKHYINEVVYIQKVVRGYLTRKKISDFLATVGGVTRGFCYLDSMFKKYFLHLIYMKLKMKAIEQAKSSGKKVLENISVGSPEYNYQINKKRNEFRNLNFNEQCQKIMSEVEAMKQSLNQRTYNIRNKYDENSYLSGTSTYNSATKFSFQKDTFKKTQPELSSVKKNFSRDLMSTNNKNEKSDNKVIRVEKKKPTTQSKNLSISNENNISITFEKTTSDKNVNTSFASEKGILTPKGKEREETKEYAPLNYHAQIEYTSINPIEAEMKKLKSKPRKGKTGTNSSANTEISDKEKLLQTLPKNKYKESGASFCLENLGIVLSNELFIHNLKPSKELSISKENNIDLHPFVSPVKTRNRKGSLLVTNNSLSYTTTKATKSSKFSISMENEFTYNDNPVKDIFEKYPLKQKEKRKGSTAEEKDDVELAKMKMRDRAFNEVFNIISENSFLVNRQYEKIDLSNLWNNRGLLVDECEKVVFLREPKKENISLVHVSSIIRKKNPSKKQIDLFEKQETEASKISRLSQSSQNSFEIIRQKNQSEFVTQNLQNFSVEVFPKKKIEFSPETPEEFSINKTEKEPPKYLCENIDPITILTIEKEKPQFIQARTENFLIEHIEKVQPKKELDFVKETRDQISIEFTKKKQEIKEQSQGGFYIENKKKKPELNEGKSINFSIDSVPKSGKFEEEKLKEMNSEDIELKKEEKKALLEEGRFDVQILVDDEEKSKIQKDNLMKAWIAEAKVSTQSTESELSFVPKKLSKAHLEGLAKISHETEFEFPSIIKEKSVNELQNDICKKYNPSLTEEIQFEGKTKEQNLEVQSISSFDLIEGGLPKKKEEEDSNKEKENDFTPEQKTLKSSAISSISNNKNELGGFNLFLPGHQRSFLGSMEQAASFHTFISPIKFKEDAPSERNQKLSSGNLFSDEPQSFKVLEKSQILNDIFIPSVAKEKNFPLNDQFIFSFSFTPTKPDQVSQPTSNAKRIDLPEIPLSKRAFENLEPITHSISLLSKGTKPKEPLEIVKESNFKIYSDNSVIKVAKLNLNLEEQDHSSSTSNTGSNRKVELLKAYNKFIAENESSNRSSPHEYNLSVTSLDCNVYTKFQIESTSLEIPSKMPTKEINLPNKIPELNEPIFQSNIKKKYAVTTSNDFCYDADVAIQEAKRNKKRSKSLNRLISKKKNKRMSVPFVQWKNNSIYRSFCSSKSNSVSPERQFSLSYIQLKPYTIRKKELTSQKPSKEFSLSIPFINFSSNDNNDNNINLLNDENLTFRPMKNPLRHVRYNITLKNYIVLRKCFLKWNQRNEKVNYRYSYLKSVDSKSKIRSSTESRTTNKLAQLLKHYSNNVKRELFNIWRGPQSSGSISSLRSSIQSRNAQSMQSYKSTDGFRQSKTENMSLRSSGKGNTIRVRYIDSAKKKVNKDSSFYSHGNIKVYKGMKVVKKILGKKKIARPEVQTRDPKIVYLNKIFTKFHIKFYFDKWKVMKRTLSVRYLKKFVERKHNQHVKRLFTFGDMNSEYSFGENDREKVNENGELNEVFQKWKRKLNKLLVVRTRMVSTTPEKMDMYTQFRNKIMKIKKEKQVMKCFNKWKKIKLLKAIELIMSYKSNKKLMKYMTIGTLEVLSDKINKGILFGDKKYLLGKTLAIWYKKSAK